MKMPNKKIIATTIGIITGLFLLLKSERFKKKLDEVIEWVKNKVPKKTPE
ncbi:MAG: hypothetical protein Q7T50_00495 [Candidatus Magasanikbacteria bacterium]|nr:hypothetical protein [Candidatus Magasanikbacteria bacterium]